MSQIAKKTGSMSHSDSRRMLVLVEAYLRAVNHQEKMAWVTALQALISRQFTVRREEVLSDALDHLYDVSRQGHDFLLEQIEAASMKHTFLHEGRDYDVYLVVAPLLAWTRFSIPAGVISNETLAALSANLSEHVFAKEAALFLAPQLYSADQLPNAYYEVVDLVHQFSRVMFEDNAYVFPEKSQAPAFLADTRYLLMGVAVPLGKSVFSWQEREDALVISAARDEALRQWQSQANAQMPAILPGCHVDVMPPNLFFTACFQSDLAIRRTSVEAGIYFLTQVLGRSAADLCAVVAPFGELSSDAPINEYRISFCMQNAPDDVLYGVIWPLYLHDVVDAPIALSASSVERPMIEIQQLLTEHDVLVESFESQRFPMEYCEETGFPLFVNVSGDLVHAEMPEDLEQNQASLH